MKTLNIADICPILKLDVLFVPVIVSSYFLYISHYIK